ncbi:MAG: imidazoleglycerol-phosphate dehydratase HisB [Myxococcales bacterium]|nr:imidazoleglycerol-phosphate dehydratase HisB [Myxococcales bacterium]
MARAAQVRRVTQETQIEIELDLDGEGRARIETPLPFFNHMLEAFARHGLFDLTVIARGDVEIDGHHTVEDTGLALGEAFKQALGERRGIGRYGECSLPMDETLAQAVIDFSGRPALVWRVDGLDGKWVGGFDCMLAHEFFQAFVNRSECNLHMLLHYGVNAHHILEALWKACARAARAGVAIDPRLAGAIPSTKGTLTA